jgi:hypothetical protein
MGTEIRQVLLVRQGFDSAAGTFRGLGNREQEQAIVGRRRPMAAGCRIACKSSAFVERMFNEGR